MVSRLPCLTLCDPMDWSPPGSSVCRILQEEYWRFLLEINILDPPQEYWSSLPCPSPRDLPNSGAEPLSPVSPELQVNSLPTKQPRSFVIWFHYWLFYLWSNHLATVLLGFFTYSMGRFIHSIALALQWDNKCENTCQIVTNKWKYKITIVIFLKKNLPSRTVLRQLELD